MARDSPTAPDRSPDRRGRPDSLRLRLARIIDVLRGSIINVEPHYPERHGRLISFSGIEVYEEVDRYWVNAPYPFISINFDPEANAHKYVVVEPELDASEREVLDDLMDDAGQMGEESVKAGAKHATGMLAIAYLVFLVFA